MPCDMIATVSAQLTCDMHNFFKLPTRVRTNILRTVFGKALDLDPERHVTAYCWRETAGFTVGTHQGTIYFELATNKITADASNPQSPVLQAARTLLPQIASLSAQLLLAQVVQSNFKTIAQTTTPAGAIAITIEV